MNASPQRRPRLAVIACAVLDPELQYIGADQDHLVHVDVLEQDLHNDPERLRTALQEAVTRAEAVEAVEAITLLYGLCSRGSEGVSTSRVPMIIPRAHDCITLLLGSRERYADYIARYPGTYWYSPGWIATDTQPGPKRYETTYKQYLEAYGEDNAEYLMEMEQGWMREYNRATYVDVGVGDVEEDMAFTQSCAQWLGWNYDRLHGDVSLLRDLLEGRWDSERFLILRPGETLRLTSDERVIDIKPS